MFRDAFLHTRNDKPIESGSKASNAEEPKKNDQKRKYKMQWISGLFTSTSVTEAGTVFLFVLRKAQIGRPLSSYLRMYRPIAVSIAPTRIELKHIAIELELKYYEAVKFYPVPGTERITMQLHSNNLISTKKLWKRQNARANRELATKSRKKKEYIEERKQKQTKKIYNNITQMLRGLVAGARSILYNIVGQFAKVAAGYRVEPG